VFENRMLRRIFGPKRVEVSGGWRKLHNEKLHDLYSLPSIIRMMKSKRMRWARHIVYIGAESNACRILVWKPESEWLILRWILERYNSVVWTELIWLRLGTSGRFS
jgi:hypothetical protein